MSAGSADRQRWDLLDAFTYWQATKQLEDALWAEEVHEHAAHWFDMRKHSVEWVTQRQRKGAPTSYREGLARVYDGVRGLASDQVSEFEHARHVARCRFIAAALRFQDELDAIDEMDDGWNPDQPSRGPGGRRLWAAAAQLQAVVDEHGWALAVPAPSGEAAHRAVTLAAIDADRADIDAGRRPIDTLSTTRQAA